MKDDGVGVHAIRSLSARKFPANIKLEIIDGGLEPDLAVIVDEGVDKLIIIDAVRANSPAGCIHRLTIDSVENSGYETRSAHYLNMKQSLALMRIAGTLPKEIIVIGIEPKDMSMGMELSPEITEKLPAVVEMVVGEITRN